MGVLSFLKPSTSRSSSSEAAAPATGGKKAKADLKNESTRDMLIRTGQMVSLVSELGNVWYTNRKLTSSRVSCCLPLSLAARARAGSERVAGCEQGLSWPSCTT